MTTTPQVLIQTGYVPATETTAYTSTGARTIIDKYSVYNADSVPRAVTVKVVPSGGTAGASHVLVTRWVQPGMTENLPEVIGRILAPGDFISEIATTASVLVRRAEGRVVTL